MAADPRFFEALGPVSAADLARVCDARVIGEAGREAEAIGAPADAGPGILVFLSDPKAAEALKGTGAIVLIAGEAEAEALSGKGHTALLTGTPRTAFSKAAARLVRPRAHEGVEFIDPSAEIDPSAHLAPGCIIGADAKIGARASIGAGAVIGPGVEIGEGTRIGARAAIGFALVGAHCEISAGAVIGETGFGLAYEKGEMLTLPHVGRVVIEDEVTLGANVTIDRGMFADTRLKTGCRIDNLSHIAHNTVIGEYAVMAAFAGISGSVTIGRGAQLGGRVGIADHLEIGEGARLAADAAIMRSVPSGEMWAGSPAQPMREFMRETAWVRRESARARKRKKSDPQ